MELPVRVAIVLTICCTLANTAGATFGGSDDFNDNVADPSRWGTDVIDGTGALNEINARLEYTGRGRGVSDANRPWILNLGNFNEDFVAQLDVYNFHNPSGNEISSCGFEVFDQANTLNSVFTELYAVTKNNGKGFYSVLRDNDTYAAEAVTGDIGATFGSVRIAYNSLTHVMTTSYDSTGSANGYQWIQLGSFGINGTGGTTGNANWGMNGSSQFLLYVYGYSESVVIPAGMLYVDNFMIVPEASALFPVVAVAGAAVAFTHRRRSRY